VDDHNLFRGGLKGLLASRDDLQVTGEATNGAELIALLPDVEADVVLLDIDMPVMGGEEATQKALDMQPGLGIIALTMHGEGDYYARMAALGARGFLLKDSSFDEVVEAIFAVAGGGAHLTRESLPTEPEAAESPTVALSVRELEILGHICRGESNHEIARLLFISKRTVDKHRANILEKTGCRNAAGLAVYAMTRRLVNL
jgi:DNA-binding NarL/FixJ family response regulator